MDILKELIAELTKPRVRPKAKKSLCGVVVDMLPGFLERHRKSEVNKIVENQLKIIDFLNQGAYPITVIEYVGYGKTISKIKNAVEKNKQPTYILKRVNDGFTDTSLLERLRQFGADHLVFMGVNESHCVFETCQSAYHFGFQVSTSKEVIRDYRSSPLQTSVRRWYKQNCTIYTQGVDELLRQLSALKSPAV